MIDVNEMRDSILAACDLPNVDERYTFYYDETNNVRKLHLTSTGMNIRRPDCFVLGGIVHRGSPRPIALAELHAALRLQPSVKEIKLKHLGAGGFLDLLTSSKLETLLEWLRAQEFLLHYQVIDLLYWSIVDIVDSIVTEVGRERRSAFIAELRDLVEHREPLLGHFPFFMLKGLLQAAKELESLPYLEDETPHVLIDGFGSFFLNRLCLFTKAQHILDDEKQIEAYLESLPLIDNGVPLRHFRFANSQSESGVQLSDPVAGLLGKLFSHLNRTPLDELEEEMANLTNQQRRSLRLLARLLDASTDECPAFAQYVISAQDRHRASFVLEGEALTFGR